MLQQKGTLVFSEPGERSRFIVYEGTDKATARKKAIVFSKMTGGVQVYVYCKCVGAKVYFQTVMWFKQGTVCGWTSVGYALNGVYQSL